MDLWVEFLLICLFGGIVAIDTTASWQVMISQPLAACTIIGFLLGDPQTGLLLGILMQLPWLIEIPAGGSHTSEGNIGALVAAGLTIHLVHFQINTLNIALVFSISWSLWISWVGGKLVDSMRRTNVMFAYRADKVAVEGNLKRLTLLNMGGVGHAYFLGFFLAGISFLLGVLVLSRLVAFVPSFFDTAFGYAKIGMIALGAGTLFSMFISRGNYRNFVIGLAVAGVVYFIF